MSSKNESGDGSKKSDDPCDDWSQVPKNEIPLHYDQEVHTHEDEDDCS